MSNKIDELLHQESEAQFPTEKREQIVDEYLARRAQIKRETVAICMWCDKQFLIKNSREKVKICTGCENGRPVITRYMESHKLAHLSLSDKQNIANSKTTRLGSGKAWN